MDIGASEVVIGRGREGVDWAAELWEGAGGERKGWKGLQSDGKGAGREQKGWEGMQSDGKGVEIDRKGGRVMGSVWEGSGRAAE